MKKCKQCEDGIKEWGDKTYESLLEQYRESKMSLPDLVYHYLIPYSLFHNHRKYCDITSQKILGH